MKETKIAKKVDWELVGIYAYQVLFGGFLIITFYGAIWTNGLLIKSLASIVFMLFILFKAYDLLREGLE